MATKQFAVIIAAAGKSSRFKDPSYKKPFYKLNHRAVWLHSAQLFHQRSDVGQIIVVIAPEDKSMFLDRYGPDIAVLGIHVVEGGVNRAQSVANGVAEIKDEFDFVAVHDAARPCLKGEWVTAVFAAATQTGAAILATPVWSTLKKSIDGRTIASTIDRAGVFLAQTPQVFRKDWLQEAISEHSGANSTDESQLMEAAGRPVAIVEGSPLNIKITDKTDIAFAKMILKSFGGGAKGDDPIASLFG